MPNRIDSNFHIYRDRQCRVHQSHCSCSVCAEVEPESPTGSINYDLLIDPEDALSASSTSTVIPDLTKDEDPWKLVRGPFINVTIYTTPGLCSMAPLGLSKFTHLADGCVDLVLVRNVERKNFIRHLKRHGSAKNQFDFDFIETHRVKAVQFRQISDSDRWLHYSEPFDAFTHSSPHRRRPSTAVMEMSVADDAIGVDGTEDAMQPGQQRASRDGLSNLRRFSSMDRLTRRARAMSVPTVSFARQRVSSAEHISATSQWCVDGDVCCKTELDFRQVFADDDALTNPRARAWCRLYVYSLPSTYNQVLKS
ncbi:PREDICTED: uncharacterized protein LOC106819244 [Priapulus caudatus]|uniref:Uncharacterized protein LOC106819244 n=1 Tax=Priapulus caudatus TaxID=37621 RepID=A0ABM1F4K5_PRICU|nr:PREDICTED: uncharacterized protein LOC106819244 [Priapulus caudatus]